MSNDSSKAQTTLLIELKVNSQELPLTTTQKLLKPSACQIKDTQSSDPYNEYS